MQLFVDLMAFGLELMHCINGSTRFGQKIAKSTYTLRGFYSMF